MGMRQGFPAQILRKKFHFVCILLKINVFNTAKIGVRTKKNSHASQRKLRRIAINFPMRRNETSDA
ncbi:MAG: hypothetical protein J1F25_04790, partial [Prevotellaceae bacterium]|nr:hypothetical protein [Prevotellaceae bacterium]